MSCFKTLLTTRTLNTILNRCNFNIGQLNKNNSVGNKHQLVRERSKLSDSDGNQVLYSFLHKLPLMGCVEIDVPFNMQLYSLDMENTDFDTAKIKLISTSNDNDFENIKSNSTLQASLTSPIYKITGTLQDTSLIPKIICIGEIPLQYDVNAVLRGVGGFNIEDMESRNISVQTDSGDISCNRLKCEKITLNSKSGDILCPGVIHGNIDMKTQGVGKVDGVRLEGGTINIETENGNVTLSAIYSEKSTFTSVSGKLDLDNFHGNGIIKIHTGDLNIIGLDGSLRAEIGSGNVCVLVTRLSGLYIKNKQGDVEVKMPNNLQGRVELEAKEFTIDPRLQAQGEFKKKEGVKTFSGLLGVGHGPLIIIFAHNGSVKLSIQDWMSSLQLGGVIPEFSPKEEII